MKNLPGKREGFYLNCVIIWLMNLKIKILILIFLVIFLALVCFLLFDDNDSVNEKAQQNNQEQSQNKVCFNDYCFFVEIAKTQEERENGLMFCKELPQSQGMLFIFEQEDIYSFWMKNTLIPLDMIWLDKNKKVVFIKESAMPCGQELCETIIPQAKALYVLEINVGKSEDIGLRVGDSLSFFGIE